MPTGADWQERAEGGEVGGLSCSFALRPTMHVLYFMIFLHVSSEAAQTVKSIGQSGGVLDEF